MKQTLGSELVSFSKEFKKLAMDKSVNYDIANKIIDLANALHDVTVDSGYQEALRAEGGDGYVTNN